MYENARVEVLEWARSRGLLEKGDPTTQCLKLVEEVGELASALLKSYPHGTQASILDVEDAIGDIQVVLINLCAMLNVHPTVCLVTVLDVIKKRKGRMVNGTFVKDETQS